MYENACKLMAKQSVALEVLSYHAMAPAEDTDRLKVITPATTAIIYRNHRMLRIVMAYMRAVFRLSTV